MPCEKAAKPLSASSYASLGRAVLPVTLLIAALMLAGCTAYMPAHRDSAPHTLDPPITLAERDWPPRTTTNLPAIVASTPREVAWWTLDGSRAESELDPRVRAALKQPQGLIPYTGVHGVGIVRVIEDAPRAPETVPADSGDTRKSGPSSPQPAPNAKPVSSRPDVRAPMLLRFVSYSQLPDRPMDRRARWLMRSLDRAPRTVPPGVRPTDPKTLRMLWEGTAIRVIPPAVPDPSAASIGAVLSPNAGVLLHMPGLGSLRYEQPVLDELSRRGWTIVRINTPRLWWFEDSTFEVNAESDITPTAQRLARVVDDLLAEPAYAAEGVLDYLRTVRPDLGEKPLVLLGMSAGALMIPTVAARLGDNADAVVLVGGGANLLRISQRSELTDAGIKLKIATSLDRRRTLDRLSEEYLLASRLDPYHAAAAIRDTPALVVLAGMDTIVPAESGVLLWERLGKPDRYTYAFGHALMFWSMSSQTQRIADWIDRAADAAALPRELPLSGDD